MTGCLLLRVRGGGEGRSGPEGKGTREGDQGSGLKGEGRLTG